MRYLILLLVLCSVSGCLTTRPDALFKDITRVFFEGTTTTNIVPDTITPDRYRIKDNRTGATKATIIPDYLFPDRYIIRKGVW